MGQPGSNMREKIVFLWSVWDRNNIKDIVLDLLLGYAPTSPRYTPGS